MSDTASTDRRPAESLAPSAGFPPPLEPCAVQFLWRYMVHADGQMLAAAGSVGDEPFFREQRISAGLIHKLLVHSIGAQRIWLERLSGRDPRRMLGPDELPTLADAAAYWPPLHAELLEFADRQTAASLATILHGHNSKGVPFALPVGVVMLHVADHATYHRGQLNSMIKLVGGSPSAVMMYTYGLAQMAAAGQ